MRILIGLISAIAAPCTVFASDIDHCHAINPNTQPEDSVAACNAYLDLNPDDPQAEADALQNRGVAYRELGDLDKSARDLQASVELYETTEALRMLAWTYREMYKHAEAEAIYTEVLTQDDHWQGWLSRCVVRLDLKRYQRALGDCEQALLRDPSNTDALFFGARAHNFLGNGARALPLAQQAVSLSPEVGYYWAELAWAHYLSGDTASARTIAEEALQTFPNETGIIQFLKQIQ